MFKLSTNSKTDILIHLGIIISTFLIIFFAFFFVFLPWKTNHGESVKVPDLRGLSITEAENLLDDIDLDYEISDCTFVSGHKPLSVFSHYPKAGNGVKSGRKIYLTIISEKAPMVKIPDVLQRSSSSAKNLLLSVGLLHAGTEFIPALEENTVLKLKMDGKEVEPGQSIPKGAGITLVVGDGYGNTKIDIPLLVGMPFDEADIMIAGLGLNVGNVIYESSDKPGGTVIKQRPAPEAGSTIKLGQSIDIWVSEYQGLGESNSNIE